MALTLHHWSYIFTASATEVVKRSRVNISSRGIFGISECGHFC